MRSMAKEELKKIDIETADPRERRKLILQLTWPALGENLLSTLVSLADSAMVATLGTYAISAVGLVTQPRFIVFSAFMALPSAESDWVLQRVRKGFSPWYLFFIADHSPLVSIR